jgi:hypothetical protein
MQLIQLAISDGPYEQLTTPREGSDVSEDGALLVGESESYQKEGGDDGVPADESTLQRVSRVLKVSGLQVQ